MSNLNNDDLFHQITTMNELTREQKRIRIAEACGWKQVEQSDGDWINGPSPMYPWTNGKDWSDESGEDLPDYFGSLDAMHEAEETLSDVQHNAYRAQLGATIRTEQGLKDASILSRKFASATAAERAEAFGRTLNLW